MNSVTATKTVNEAMENVMNPITATKMVTEAMEQSEKKFEYLLTLGEIYGNIEITRLTIETDFYSEYLDDYIHAHHDGPFQPISDPNVDIIPLSTKTVSLKVSEQVIPISQVEYLEQRRKVKKVFLIDGYRTTYDDYEGTQCDSMEMSAILDIPQTAATSLISFLVFSFQLFETLYPKADEAIQRLFKDDSQEEDIQ